MTDYVYIGSSPCDEDCAQVGSPRYYELSRLELNQFKAAIIQKMGQPPDGCSLIVKEGEIVAKYEVGNEKAEAYAFSCEDGAPATWEEVGMKAPKLDDDDFAATELIQVPEGVRPASMNPEKCDLHGTSFASRSCLQKIGNQFIDGFVPGASWANMCPACAGHNRVRFGTGLGQRYRKAKDGEWYCVEGSSKAMASEA